LAVRVLLLSLGLIVAGCGCGRVEKAAPVPTQTSTQLTPPPGPSPTEHFGYIRSVSTAGPTATLAFDEAQFLSGDVAQRAAEEDGAVETGESVPNDYYVRNRDKTTRTLRISNDAKITAKRCQLCRHGRDGQLDAFLASFMKQDRTYATPYRGKYSQYWLTIKGDEVAAIDEQYVP
jgi:hypothetical protein